MIAGVALVGIATFFAVWRFHIPSVAAAFVAIVAATVTGYGYFAHTATGETQPPDDERGPVFRGWIAVCSGWWLVGATIGVWFLTDTYSGATREMIGNAPILGGAYAGLFPYVHGASAVASQGGQMGYSGAIIGLIVTVVVWATLPVALAEDSRHRLDRRGRRRLLIGAAFPYVAGGAGLVYLYRTNYDRGQTRLRAAGVTLASAAVGYLAGAAIVFVLGLVILSFT